MKKIMPILFALLILAGIGYFVLQDGNTPANNQEPAKTLDTGAFNEQRSCARIPAFLNKMGIKRPIIDLSQINYKGIAFYYGADFKKVLHKKEWEAYDALGTYTIDSSGNIYLTPNPFISIKPSTFNLQKAIYKIDSASGKLERWMVIDDVNPNATNPYGLISVVFDCDDGTLWASAIDESNYKAQKGEIYHINPKTQDILQKISGFDALTINILHAKNGKFLLAGSARKNALYAFKIENSKIINKPYKLLELPEPNLRIRKIKIIGANTLKLEAIKFNYSLIAQTAKKQRIIFIAKYNKKNWIIHKK